MCVDDGATVGLLCRVPTEPVMSEPERGNCPGCGTPGAVGAQCGEKACVRLGFHYIPERWYREQKNAAADPVVGQMIGDFLVVAFIGSGGFGKVYLCLQSPLFRLKGALKMLELPSTNAVVVNAMLQKFRQEAEALAELTHPNIVRLLKYGTHNERPYLVMEYLGDGRTLREEIWSRAKSNEGYSHDELRDILGQVLNALEAAHARNIIHRDIKPENIMIQPVAGHPNHLKILDFGTAKFTAEREDTAWPLGSPSYMAPEQIEMRGIGPWSDLFAVGVLSFELMSGRKPFPGETEHSIVSKKLDLDYDPLVQLVGLDFPDITTAFLRRAIAIDAEARFRDVASFRDGLDQAINALGSSSSVVGPDGVELTSLLASQEIEIIEKPDQDEIDTKVGYEEVPGSIEVSLGDEPSQPPPIPLDARSEVSEDAPSPTPARTEEEVGDSNDADEDDEAVLAPSRAPLVLGIGATVVAIMGGAWSLRPEPIEPPVAPLEPAVVATTDTRDAAPDVHDAALDSSDAADVGVSVDASNALTGRISAVTAGKFHSCVALYDGRVRCWGSNFDGELGLGHSRVIGDNELPTAEKWIEFVDGVVQIESAGDRGSSFSCVLSKLGDVRCWGANGSGQLGLGHTGPIGARNRVGGPGHGNVQLGDVAIDVAVGGSQFGSHACAVLQNNAVRCWGGNKLGQLGLGNKEPVGDNEQPRKVATVQIGGAVMNVAAGKQHNCALVEGGKIVCWGYNKDGQLGYGHTETIGDDETPQSAGFVDVGGPVRKVAAGRGHSCAILQSGGLRCWGWNKEMQLGLGHTDDIGDDELAANAPFVEVGADVMDVGLGANHTCALLERGEVKCWGDNRFGQLGYGNEAPVGDPSAVGTVDLGAPVVALYVGSYHNCAILDGDVLRCWGLNKYGQLGLGHKDDIGDDEVPSAVPPVAVFDASDVEPATAGDQ